MKASRVSWSHFRFGSCEIDAATRTLTRRGRLVEIEPRVFDLLLHLIDHHHRVVSPEELLRSVWGDTAVTLGSVSQAVHKARVAIGDIEAGVPRSIVTVRGRGFRFVAPLKLGREPIELAEGELVGRAHELACLERSLERLQQGHGALVYLAGEPGIGKSRIVQEIVARASAGRIETHVSRCAEGDESSGFWPWRQLARKLARAHTPGELERLGTYRVMELQRAERELSAEQRPEAAAEFFDPPTLMRLFASATEGIARLALDRPMLLIVEDIHWADVASLLYLRFLARELPGIPILVVATFRDGALAAPDRRAHLLAEAERSANGETLILEALSPEETLRLAEKQIGRPVSAPLLDSLCALSGGNPYLLGEIVRRSRLRSASGIATHPPGLLELPAIVRAAVTAQIAGLGPQGRRMLAMASVLGTEFELVPLAAALQLATERVFCSITDAVAARVLVPVAGKTHSFRFAHALVREALYEGIPVRERARLHLRAACALEASARAGPALLAYHFCEAAAVGGAERGVEAACEAARLSLSRLDFERASGELEQALRCLDFVPDASPRRRCEILVAAAEAASRLDPRRGRLRLAEGARIARRMGDSAQALLDAIAHAEMQMERESARSVTASHEPRHHGPEAACPVVRAPRLQP